MPFFCCLHILYSIGLTLVHSFFRSLILFLQKIPLQPHLVLLAVLKVTLMMLPTLFSPSVYVLVIVLSFVVIDSEMKLQFHTSVGRERLLLKRDENWLGLIRLW